MDSCFCIHALSTATREIVQLISRKLIKHFVQKCVWNCSARVFISRFAHNMSGAALCYFVFFRLGDVKVFSQQKKKTHFTANNKRHVGVNLHLFFTDVIFHAALSRARFFFFWCVCYFL